MNLNGTVMSSRLMGVLLINVDETYWIQYTFKIRCLNPILGARIQV